MMKAAMLFVAPDCAFTKRPYELVVEEVTDFVSI